MGNALGRAARSTPKRVVDPAVAAQALSIKEKEAAQTAALRASLQQAPPPEDLELPDESGQQLKQLLRAIESRPLDLYRDAKGSESMQRRKKSKEERDAEAVGRLDTQALRAALEEVLRAEQAGRAVPLADVARRYGADEGVLRETLQHCGLVPVEKAADGRLVAARKTFNGSGSGSSGSGSGKG